MRPTQQRLFTLVLCFFQPACYIRLKLFDKWRGSWKIWAIFSLLPNAAVLKARGWHRISVSLFKIFLNRKLSFQSKPLYSKLEGNPLHFTSPIIRGYALLVHFKIRSFIYSRKHKLLSLIESTIFSLGKSLSLSLTESFRVGRPNGLHWVIKMPNLSLLFSTESTWVYSDGDFCRAKFNKKRFCI